MQKLSFDDYSELSHSLLMQLHIRFIELIDDEELWRLAGYAGLTGANLHISAANRIVPNIVLNWADRLLSLNEITWRNIQRMDSNGILSRVSFAEFVQFVRVCVLIVLIVELTIQFVGIWRK